MYVLILSPQDFFLRSWRSLVARDDIVSWLKAPNFRPIQQTAIAQRMLDTGTWFIESVEFQQLMNGDGYQLWGTGMRE